MDEKGARRFLSAGMNTCGLPAVKWCRITVTTIKAGAAGFPYGRL
jgi:hypothetical protein